MTFLYLFTFSAPWLPWVILTLGWVLGQDPVDDLIGIGIGILHMALYMLFGEYNRRLDDSLSFHRAFVLLFILYSRSPPNPSHSVCSPPPLRIVLCIIPIFTFMPGKHFLDKKNENVADRWEGQKKKNNKILPEEIWVYS
jgi:hypothetical protein